MLILCAIYRMVSPPVMTSLITLKKKLSKMLRYKPLYGILLVRFLF